MFGRLMPREEKFFDLFRDIADEIVKGATEFQAMLGDMGHVESRARTIKDIEHRGDNITHRTVELLHTTFITPLDREDIHELIKSLDDILDFLEAASQRIWLYGITEATPEMHRLAEICTHSAHHVRSAVAQLSNLKHPDEIIKICVEINRLENEGDHALRASMAKLFKEENDVKKLIKLKEVYELLETVTDRCEDVANIIEGIVLEYA
ncbi:MAG: DUF47 domain-containing protein [Deltaproteobacteria bacterium]|nr:DUF47 domain-containing protein [Deltaproteobacteria bacterium]